jgi:hypothetical protein
MLNNLTNFFNLIRGRKIKKTLANSDLIAIGVRDDRFDGNYQPSAIKYEDLAAQVGGLQTVAVDGVTITGDGTPGNPLVASIPSTGVNYSNVAFVDASNGNDGTGIRNRFDRPYLTIPTAAFAAVALPGLSTSNRALVYVRRGEYLNPGTIQFYDNIDYYFEPGSYLTGSVLFRDLGVTVNANVYGSVKINSTSVSTMLQIQGDSVITFEFDFILSTAAAWYILPSGTSNKITINGNYVYSQTLGQGWGVGFRNATNAVVNIKYAVEAIHSVVMWRFFTGNVTFNCPNINLTSGNIYGGNNKQALVVYDASSNGKITVNGNVNNLDTVNYGGIGSLITFWSAPNTKFTLNGNAYGGVIKALDGNVYASGSIEINGNLSSNNLYTVVTNGSVPDGKGEVVIKNATIINTSGDGLSRAVRINGKGRYFFKDCYISSALDTITVDVNTTSADILFDDCQLYSSGLSGSSIASSVGAVNIRAKNSMSNKATTVDITNIYAPQGTLEVNANVINPTIIN